MSNRIARRSTFRSTSTPRVAEDPVDEWRQNWGASDLRLRARKAA